MLSYEQKIPKRHGELYFEPGFSQWKEDALRNRERVVKQTLWGQSALKARAILKLPTDQPIIFSGHQPVLHHPGLWAKCLAASTLAESVQGTAFHKITDTDLAAEHLHYLPEVEDNGKSRRKLLEFFSTKDLKQQEKTTPYCFLPAPSLAALESIFADAQIYCPGPVKERMRELEEKIKKGLTKEATWNDFHMYTLRLLDEICGTQRQYLQAHKLWSSQPFLQFMAQWLSNLPEMNENYNQSLNEYRKKYGITHDLTPLPNLKFESWWFEIPFWGVTKYHQRHSVWAKHDGGHIILRIKGGDGTYSLSKDNLVQELGTLVLTLWPKAIPQTLFCRMYLCDYFIHGLGGASYEEVGDTLFTKTFKLKPLSYGVVSATYQVDPRQSRGVEAVMKYDEKITWWQRALDQNPEYLFTKSDAWKTEIPPFMHPMFQTCFDNPALKKLAEEKTRLVGEMQDPAKREETSQKIKKVNVSLYDGYSPVLKAMEQALLDVSKVKDTWEVLTYREYPFFCYPAQVFTDMKEKIRHAANREADKPALKS